ncbi:glucose/arabinose dehydrogenase [Glaciihabitans tibetensis]|uniref:Glucose/arabinose dehydrogenase n=1 Tax=Glaciihabitans tibetensis TaxID=1266600 RepID=A0A2T0VBR3_9MICO|nr:PQQ-dependent sugar dehydrogenase [Glaciihabitans tibetensis]PRY67527.1 glucose/arabinose dehydrogenase [Glaciihabitans tibetensis]
MASSQARLRRSRSLRATVVPASAGFVAAVLTLSGCTTGVPLDPAPVPSISAPPASSPSASSPPAAPPTNGATPAQPAAPASPAGPVQPEGEPRVVATELNLPWSLVRLDTGATLVSERDTAIVKEVSDAGVVRDVGLVNGVIPGGEGGLLGLTVWTEASDTPDAPPMRWLYAYLTSQIDNRVVRMPLLGAAGTHSLGAPETILSGIPKAGNHNGGRIKFGPDGALYITAGDAGVRDSSQNLDELGGKILRVAADGSVPADNPFPGSPVYSYGHRNPQGIAWDRDGNLWASEFGQNTWDELNLIEPGINYGWPVVEGIGSDSRFRNPVHQWSTDEASPSGLLWTRDTLFLAALRGERLWSIAPTPEAVTTTSFFAGQFGRMRDVIEGPNDTLWILTNNTGRAPRDGDDKILEVRVGALNKG